MDRETQQKQTRCVEGFSTQCTAVNKKFLVILAIAALFAYFISTHTEYDLEVSSAGTLTREQAMRHIVMLH